MGKESQRACRGDLFSFFFLYHSSKSRLSLAASVVSYSIFFPVELAQRATYEECFGLLRAYVPPPAPPPPRCYRLCHIAVTSLSSLPPSLSASSSSSSSFFLFLRLLPRGMPNRLKMLNRGRYIIDRCCV